MSEEKPMKILHVYRSEPSDDVKTLVNILNRDREAKEFKLYLGKPNYDMLVQMIFDADQTVSWW
ncbi:hypothetical protein G3N55_00720 [Dissulfurirhabdus thermomarina]|uniref:Uncharacterized protein n=1 Tax=Dissulfurirhabdus thermomarina TaxID=1765737 RepID=A0A6N9TNP7_DISTH|nr:hypothetical protein [Dissulfurirhabdus thermomarina]NDY41374.1 hypothetical protein [Dissulfurirhabdus thermomarina]NMX23610.1 hypothetical protein [Dissulfurirhabdus thermomarina]